MNEFGNTNQYFFECSNYCFLFSKNILIDCSLGLAVVSTVKLVLTWLGTSRTSVQWHADF